MGTLGRDRYTNITIRIHSSSLIFAQFVPLMDVFPSSCVVKADQWVLLNRHDANLLVNAPKLLEFALAKSLFPVNPTDVSSVLRSLFKKVSCRQPP